MWARHGAFPPENARQDVTKVWETGSTMWRSSNPPFHEARTPSYAGTEVPHHSCARAQTAWRALVGGQSVPASTRPVLGEVFDQVEMVANQGKAGFKVMRAAMPRHHWFFCLLASGVIAVLNEASFPFVRASLGEHSEFSSAPIHYQIRRPSRTFPALRSLNSGTASLLWPWTARS